MDFYGFLWPHMASKGLKSSFGTPTASCRRWLWGATCCKASNAARRTPGSSSVFATFESLGSHFLAQDRAILTLERPSRTPFSSETSAPERILAELSWTFNDF